ncbi:MAG: sugar phosphate nucleotidyltransferase [Pseudomonadota bacterium]
MMDAVILAGGLATRLRPLSETVPKAMIQIVGKPFITHQLSLLKKSDFKRVVLCLGYMGDQIRDYLEKNNPWKLDLAFIYDGEKLLGTGGAVKKALPRLSEHFAVIYGDSYLEYKYQRIIKAFDRKRYSTLMTVYKTEDYDKSNIHFRNSQIILYESNSKSPNMKHIDWGFNVFSQRAFKAFEKRETFDLSEVLQQALKDGQLQGLSIRKRFYEIGSPNGLEELEDYLLRKKSKK